MFRIEADGPDGSTMLGFLAALGALGAIERLWGADACRLGWRLADGWRPVYEVDRACTAHELARAIYDALRGREGAEEFAFGQDVKVEPPVFAGFARQQVARATPANRVGVDFVASFACDAVASNGTMETTQLRLLTGAGQQYFLKTIRQLLSRVTEEQIRATLLRPWSYDDPGPTFRFDPVDLRVHARRGDDPSDSEAWPIRTVAGANVLASEALRFFPVAPTGRRLETTAMSRIGRRWYFGWPIWLGFLSAPVVRSVLALEVLAVEKPAAEVMEGYGIVEVFHAERLLTDRMLNFGPAFATARER